MEAALAACGDAAFGSGGEAGCGDSAGVRWRGATGAGACAGVEVSTGMSSPLGTIIVCWHFGHLTGLPMRSSHAENRLPQCRQLIRIGIDRRNPKRMQ